MNRPPPILLVGISYGAGLATGLARFPEHMLAIGMAIMVAILIHDHWWWPAPLAIAAGIASGTTAQSASASWCAARLPLGEHRYQVRSIDPGEGTGRVRFVGQECVGTVTAAWPRRERLPAGTTARVVARWAPVERAFGRPDGMLLIRSIDSVRVAPSLVERSRTAIAISARRRFGDRAPIVQALVGGWRGELDPELRRAFASSGLMHLLAISGFHIAWLAGSTVLALRLVRAPRHAAEFAGALAAVTYTAWLGWPPGATRAAVVVVVLAFCRWRQRQVRASAVAGLSIIVVLLADPWAVTSIGAWLSVAGGTGVVAATRWSDRIVGSAWWIRSISASTGAVITTAPIATAVFGQVAPIGILLNVVAMPLMLVILPATFGAVLLDSVLPAAASSLAASGNGLLAVLQWIVTVGSQTPGAGVPAGTGWPAAMPWLGVLVGATWIIHGRTTAPEAVRRMAWCGVTAFGVTLASSGGSLVADDHRLTLLFLDVGQGDAALIRTPFGHWIEVDAGPTADGWDAGRRVVGPVLARNRVDRITAFVLSHAHRDHVGGGASVLDQVPISLAVEPGELFADSAYDAWLTALAAHHVRWRAARSGTTWELDGVSFRVLHPPTPWARQGEDLNEDSIVLELGFGEFRALLMGDAGFVAESAMASELRPVNVLKVGHHGSRTASSAAFLDVVRPQVAVVSVGRNGYGHPAPETLDRLERAAARVWRTDQQGTVTVTTDGRTFTVDGVRAKATFRAGP